MIRELPLRKLSVLVTCYNKLNYVLPCFEYLREISKLGAEIVIVDDGSNDGSSKLIAEQMNHMDCKPTLRTTENRGLAAARDLAIEIATSEFIYCLDIDDTPNVQHLVEITHVLSLSSAKACAGNFWYLEQNLPGSPVIDTDEFILVNSGSVRDKIFDARGWWRYIYRRDFLLQPGNRFGKVFEDLKRESFVLDDVYWMAHLAAQDFELLISPSRMYLTNYLLPQHNAEARWTSFLRQVSLLPRASQAFVNNLVFHSCQHDDIWLYKKLFENLWDHMTILPMRKNISIYPQLLRTSWAIAGKISISYRIQILKQLVVFPLRRTKRISRELKTH